MNRILRWGFTLAFCALMAAMVVMVMPTLENYRFIILEFILLPIGTAGASLIAYANLAKLD
jgi:hypothetical protein